MRAFNLITFTLVFFLLIAVRPVSAQNTVTVSSNGPYFSLQSAVAAAGRGGTVRILAGQYVARDLRIPHDLTIIGEGEVTFTSPNRVEKGLLVPLRGVSLEVRNITFEKARSRDDNGAGIRVEGNELIVRNCIFRNNENGILAGGSDGGEITISGSSFISNGYGDGYSHGIYVSSAAQLEISDSRFEGTRIGHHVKSIANEHTIVRNTTFDDQLGQTSYMIDVTGGGDLVVESNTMLRAESAEQVTLINYDTSRGGKRGTITIRNNQIINRKPRAKLLRNAVKAPVFLQGNSFVNEGSGTLDLPLSTPGLYVDPLEDKYPFTEETSISERAGLDDLSPTQRRAVEKMMAQGESLQIIEPAELLVKERNERARKARLAVAQTSVRDILMTPEFSDLIEVGDVIGLNFVRESAARSTSPIITFAQAFKKGEVSPSDTVVFRTRNARLPAQMDVKATNRDGSVRHALLTLNTASIGMEQVHTGVLATNSNAEPSSGTIPDVDGYNLSLSVEGMLANGATFSNTVQFRDLVVEAIAEHRFWMNGPFATEVSVHQDIGPFLTVRADIRFLVDGSVRTRLVFENHKTFAIGNRDLVYNVSVKDGSTQIFSREGVAHYRGANWSEVIWKGGLPAYEVQIDPSYLIDIGAIPPFDLTFGIKRSTIVSNAAEVRAKTGMFSERLLAKYFPTSGGRSEIGILPDWDVHWLKSQNIQAREVMLAMAEAAGAIPWHFEEYGTHNPVRIDQRPKFWSEKRGAEMTYAPDNIPAGYFEGTNGGWELDSAHKPLLSYTAYLVTGDAYFARELAHEAAFSIANIWPALRADTPLVAEAIQVRSRAWTLRDIGNAAWLLPDESSLKAYFQNTLASNLSHLYTNYIVEDRMAAAAETKGWFSEMVNGDLDRISPWQNDYMIMVLGQEALRGSPVAGEIVSWAANYHIGRFLAEGADPAFGAAAIHAAKDTRTGEPVGSWSELLRRTQSHSNPPKTYPRDGSGYVTSAYAALASIYSVTGNPKAIEAMKALATAQEDDLLFDPDNDNGVYAVSNFLLATRGPDGEWRSITELLH